MGSKLFRVMGASRECELVEFEDRSGGGTGEIAITAAVGAGGANRPDDVVTIQRALNAIGRADGGPEPPLVVDGKSGPLTRSAIAKFQRKQFGWADSRVDTDNVTIARLRVYNGQGPARAEAGGHRPRLGAVPPKVGPGKKKVSSEPDDITVTVEIIDPMMERVKKAIPDAVRWAFAAQNQLFLARQLLMGIITGPARPAAEKAFALVNKYFHLKKVSRSHAIASMDRIHLIFTNIRTALGHLPPAGFVFRDPTRSNRAGGPFDAYTFSGGFTARKKTKKNDPPSGLPRMSKEDNYEGPNLREDSIFICTENIRDLLDEEITHLIVHEGAHFVGPETDQPGEIVDHSYRHKPNFFLLSPHLAIRTAECYSQFAGEAKLGREVVSNKINVSVNI